MQPIRLAVVVVVILVVAYAARLVMQSEQEFAQDFEQRKALFQDAAIRAVPLIAAIRDYRAANGDVPKRLTDLVPRYLSAIPQTGLAQCSHFEYASIPSRQSDMVWYDLGSRQGREPVAAGRFSDGDPEHAILVFMLDKQARITKAQLDRMPKDYGELAFESDAWKAGGNRIAMAVSLADKYKLHGMPRHVFEALLGPPDAARLWQNLAWELKIDCSRSFLGKELFVYWPTEQYPQEIYGGVAEPVDGWAYVYN